MHAHLLAKPIRLPRPPLGPKFQGHCPALSLLQFQEATTLSPRRRVHAVLFCPDKIVSPNSAIQSDFLYQSIFIFFSMCHLGSPVQFLYVYAQCRFCPKHSSTAKELTAKAGANTEQGQLKTVIIVLDEPEADWHIMKMFPETLN